MMQVLFDEAAVEVEVVDVELVAMLLGLLVGAGVTAVVELVVRLPDFTAVVEPESPLP